MHDDKAYFQTGKWDQFCFFVCVLCEVYCYRILRTSFFFFVITLIFAGEKKNRLCAGHHCDDVNNFMFFIGVCVSVENSQQQ